MSNYITVIAASNYSHYPAEGSTKKYSAVRVPVSSYWLGAIHHRKEGHIERLEDLFSHHVPWFGTLDLAKRYANLVHENAEGLPLPDTFPIISILGTNPRYAGMVYIDEAEAMVDDEYYKIGNLLQTIEVEVT